MTLFDLATHDSGTVHKITADDPDTHRRLVDMGLIGADVRVRAKRRRSILVDFSDSFAAVLEADTADRIEVINVRHENSALRKSERR